MAKRNNKTTETAPETTVAPVAETETSNPAAKLDVGALKSLMGEYASADKQIEAVRAKLNELEAGQGQIVRKVHELVGAKRKITFNGVQYLAIKRGDTYFFRGAGNPDSIVVN